MNNLAFGNDELKEFGKRIMELRTDNGIPDFFASVSFFNIGDETISSRLIVFIRSNYATEYNALTGQYTVYWLIRSWCYIA